MRISKMAIVCGGLLVSTLPTSVLGGEDAREQMDALSAKGRVKIGMAQAIDLAIKQVAGARPVAAELEMEGETPVFEVELLVTGKMKEVEINGMTGEVIKVEDADDDADEVAEIIKTLAGTRITLRQALDSAARKIAGGLAFEAELEMEGDKQVYHLDLLADGKFVEVEIDAATGKVLAVEEEDAEATQWGFDDDQPGKAPSGWSIRQTNPTKAMAAWQVMADPSAPSKSHAFGVVKTENYNGTFNMAIAERTSFKDLDLTVKVKAVKGEEDQGGGPIWRCQDENNYYISRFNPLESNYRVYFVKEGRRKQLRTIKVETVPGRWYTVRATMVGNHIACYLNGKKMLEVEDETFKNAGMVGLWTKSDAVTRFDDLVVRRVDDDEDHGGSDEKDDEDHDHHDHHDHSDRDDD